MADHQVEKAFQRQPTVFLAKKLKAGQKVRARGFFLRPRSMVLLDFQDRSIGLLYISSSWETGALGKPCTIEQS